MNGEQQIEIMKKGEIRVGESIVKLERRLIILERTIDFIAKNNNSVKFPTEKELKEIEEEANVELKKQHPDMDISG